LKKRDKVQMKMIWNSESLCEKAHPRTRGGSLNCGSEYIFCKEKNVSYEIIRQIENIANFLFWDHERMPEMMRIYREKRKTEFIFVDFVARDFSLNNFCKNGGHRGKLGTLIILLDE
jgi:hypothetical protein